MSTFLGHGLAALAAYQGLKKTGRLPGGVRGAGLALFLGLAADLDVLAVMAFPAYFSHRGPSHSLLFALLFAGAAFLLARPGREPPGLGGFLCLAVVAAVHPFLDYLMGCGPGVPFFWPFPSQVYLSPVQLVPTAFYSTSLRGLAGLLLHRGTLMALGLELVIFLPLFIASLLRPQRGRAWAVLLLLAGVSLGGVALTHAIYG